MEALLASEYVTIGELVRLTGIRYSTLKFYTEEGFLPYIQQEERLTRRYPKDETVKLIVYIKSLRNEGKTIPEIRDILQQKDTRPGQGRE